MLTELKEAGSHRPPRIIAVTIRLIDFLSTVAYTLSAILLAVIVMLYSMEIVLRYFFLSPTVWTRDTVTYFLAATICLAAPEIARQNGHVAITILLEMCSDRVRQFMETALALITAVVTGGVCWITAGQTARLIETGILTLGTVAVPKWWIAVFIPIGFLLVSLQYLALAFDQNRRDHDRTRI
ncbi:MAG: TRAP transporter small permease subunit [Alphaproteobacteria bacterium]|nr:TRAP transporter small permease subunit [Alphaproteobacteria bacterium]